MSDDILARRVGNLYKAVILRAFMDATVKANNKDPTHTEQRLARNWLTWETENFRLVNDLAGLDYTKTLEIALHLKSLGWPDIIETKKKRYKKVI